MNIKPFSMVTPEDIANSSFGMGDNLLFKDASSFSQFVEKTAVLEEKTCTQVVLEYCDMKDIDPDEVTKLISVSLRGKLRKEMIDAGLMPKEPTLDFE